MRFEAKEGGRLAQTRLPFSSQAVVPISVRIAGEMNTDVAVQNRAR